jgi:hypothetical protein
MWIVFIAYVVVNSWMILCGFIVDMGIVEVMDINYLFSDEVGGILFVQLIHQKKYLKDVYEEKELC